jgi:hypothetical protein
MVAFWGEIGHFAGVLRFPQCIVMGFCGELVVVRVVNVVRCAALFGSEIYANFFNFIFVVS